MVAFLEEYEQLLRQGIAVLSTLLALYSPDKQSENDWADISLADTRNQYRSFTERLSQPPVLITVEETASLSLSIRKYIDSHWADYREFPKADTHKRAKVEELHTQLELIASGFGQIYNSLRKPD